jgi:hypothetical protein
VGSLQYDRGRLMRISVKMTDPGYQTYVGIKRSDLTIAVTLDGEAVRDVLIADEEQGYIERFLRDENGKPVRSDGLWVAQAFCGVVAIDVSR